MKKQIKSLVFLTTLIAASLTQAQIAIGKTSVTNSSVLFEFGNEAKGIILPAVDSAPGAVNGTFVLNNTTKSVQVMQNGSWTNLSPEGDAADNPFSNPGPDIGDGVVIGAATSTKPGVMVLESTTQTLVLPKVNQPEVNILSPVAGTIVYDTQNSMLAVFDGNKWTFWK